MEKILPTWTCDGHQNIRKMNYCQIKEFICQIGSQSYDQTLVVEQCALQIHITQAVTTSKLYTIFCHCLFGFALF